LFWQLALLTALPCKKQLHVLFIVTETTARQCILCSNLQRKSEENTMVVSWWVTLC